MYLFINIIVTYYLLLFINVNVPGLFVIIINVLIIHIIVNAFLAHSFLFFVVCV